VPFLRVASLPPPDGEGSVSYVWLLERGLADHRVARVSGGSPNPLWVWRARRDVDILHLHWLEYLTEVIGRGPLAYLRATARVVMLIAALATARACGIALVWTIHNLRPHEDLRPRLNSLLQRAVLAATHRTIVHSRYAAEQVLRRHPAASPAVVPHGNYVGVLEGSGRSRAAIRQELGVPADGTLFLAFGQVRPYKRLPLLLTAFRDLPDPDARLVVAGRAVDDELAKELRGLASRDGRVQLRLEFADEDVAADLHHAADSAVFAYADLFSSGALLLALSLGLPVVAPEGTAAAELVESSALVEFGPGGLTSALAHAASEFGPAAREAALRSAQRYDWGRVAELTTEVYAQALAEARPPAR
jgi:beta-1,4-mannosyltransferase